MGISWSDIKSVGADILPYVGAGAGFIAGGPVGAGLGYGAGSMVGNWLDPNDPSGGASGSEQQKLQSFSNAQGKYANYRGQMVGERNQALQNQMNAYQGAQNALTNMYGGAPSMSFAPMQAAPAAPRTFNLTQPNGINPAAPAVGRRTTSFQPSTAPVQSVQQTNAAIARMPQTALKPTPVAGAAKLAGVNKAVLRKDVPTTTYSPAQVRTAPLASKLPAKTTALAPKKIAGQPKLSTIRR